MAPCVWDRIGDASPLEKKTRISALRFTKLSTVMVMDSFGSAGLPSKEKSLYEYLIGKHTFNSFASPSPSSAPFWLSLVEWWIACFKRMLSESRVIDF